MSYREKEIEKRYWTVSEVAVILKEDVSCIRFWALAFAIDVHRNKAGARRFTKENIEDLQEVHRLLRTERYTVEGAKKKYREFQREIQTMLAVH